MDIRRYRTTAASNNTASPDGWPEGMPSAGVNDSDREFVAQVKTWWDAGGGYYVAKSSNYTIIVTDDGTATTNDNRRIIECTASLTLTVPAATGATANWGCAILNSSASGVVTVARSSTDTINGATSIKMYPGEYAILHRKSSSAWLLSGLPRMALIETQTASASSALNFVTGFDDSQFRSWEFQLKNILPATDAADLRLRISHDGVTYEADAADYMYHLVSQNAGVAGMTSVATSTGNTFILLTNAQGNVSGEGGNGWVRVPHVGASQTRPIMSDISYLDSTATPVFIRMHASGIYVGAATAITAFRFLCSSGNIASGNITVYGVRDY